MGRPSEAARRRFLIVLGIVGVLGLLWLVVVVAPPWFVQGRSLDDVERLKAENDIRTTLLQGLGGAVLAVGAYFTYRQLHTAREGQITERYTRAIDQLGHTELDVRLGGIYALERIARDSPADHGTIAEVLTAFIRGHAPWPPNRSDRDDATRVEDDLSLRQRAPDVQASLTVLGRGGFGSLEPGDDRLDLNRVDLRRADLGAAHLEQALLMDAHLERAKLDHAHLERAYIGGAHLQGADLRGAHLQGAILSSAHLEQARLVGAHLERAYLDHAHLERAKLDHAHLQEADLGRAHLETAILRGAHLEGAVADEQTSWPAGFDWHGAGVIVRSD